MCAGRYIRAWCMFEGFLSLLSVLSSSSHSLLPILPILPLHSTPLTPLHSTPPSPPTHTHTHTHTHTYKDEYEHLSTYSGSHALGVHCHIGSQDSQESLLCWYDDDDDGMVIMITITMMVLPQLSRRIGIQIGISFKTQVLYAVVFFTRYLDLVTHYVSLYNSLMKLFFMASSAYVVYLMELRFRGTNDRSLDTFRVEYLVVPSAVLALLFHYQFTLLEVRSLTCSLLLNLPPLSHPPSPPAPSTT